MLTWLPERLRPAVATQPAEAAQAPPLLGVSLFIGLLGGLSLPAAIQAASQGGWTSATIEAALNASFGIAALLAAVLIWGAHVRAAAWTLLVGSVLIWAIGMPTLGLTSQVDSQFLLVFPLLLAGLVLDRWALWGSALVLLAAMAAGASFDAAAGMRSGTSWLGRHLPGFSTVAGNLVLFGLLVDWFGVRVRNSLGREADKSRALAKINAELLTEQQERAQLERALATNERLETVGRFAGSVAHDFNNLLTGMLGNVELSAELSEDPEVREMLGVTTSLIGRAKTLTRNLLRFSKGASLEAEQLDVHTLIRESERIYQSVIGDEVELVFELEAERVHVAFNAGQFEQILLNLIVNAADAMPEGGRLQIVSRNAERSGVAQLELVVVDEGVGMSDTIMGMVFEPYFTTKGQGTGIGLATVHELVTGAGGDISVESELGQGTTFRLSLPLAPAAGGPGKVALRQAGGDHDATSEP